MSVVKCFNGEKMTFGVAAANPIELAITDSPRVNLNALGPVKAVFLNIYVGKGGMPGRT